MTWHREGIGFFCLGCGRRSASERVPCDCRPALDPYRFLRLPGNQLHRLLRELNIGEGCEDCRNMRRQMNLWRVRGCRENKSEIVGHLRTAYKKTDWQQILSAGREATKGLLVLSIAGHLPRNLLASPLSLLDAMLGSLVDEAIERAEQVGGEPA